MAHAASDSSLQLVPDTYDSVLSGLVVQAKLKQVSIQNFEDHATVAQKLLYRPAELFKYGASMVDFVGAVTEVVRCFVPGNSAPRTRFLRAELAGWAHGRSHPSCRSPYVIL